MNYKFLFFFILLISYSCKTDKKTPSKESIPLYTEEIKIEHTKEKKQKIIISTQNAYNELKKNIGKLHRENISFDNSDLYLNGGALISDIYNGKEYSLSTISGENDIVHYVLFEEVTSKNNIPSFKIIDVLNIDNKTRQLLSNPEIELYIIMAYKDQVVDEEVIAIATYEDNKVFTEIHQAWRADRKTEKFIEISTEGITVDNVLY